MDPFRKGDAVVVEWGLEDPLPGKIIDVYGSPVRPTAIVELEMDGARVDVPFGALHRASH